MNGKDDFLANIIATGNISYPGIVRSFKNGFSIQFPDFGNVYITSKTYFGCITNGKRFLTDKIFSKIDEKERLPIATALFNIEIDTDDIAMIIDVPISGLKINEIIL